MEFRHPLYFYWALLFILIKIYRLGFSNSNFPPLFKKCEERRIFWLLVIVDSNPDPDFMFVHTLLMFFILLCLRFSIPFVAPNLNWKKPSQYVLVKYKAKNFKIFLIGTNYIFFSPTMNNFEFRNLEVVFKIDYKKKINF